MIEIPHSDLADLSVLVYDHVLPPNPRRNHSIRASHIEWHSGIAPQAYRKLSHGLLSTRWFDTRRSSTSDLSRPLRDYEGGCPRHANLSSVLTATYSREGSNSEIARVSPKMFNYCLLEKANDRRIPQFVRRNSFVLQLLLSYSAMTLSTEGFDNLNRSAAFEVYKD